MTPPFQKIKKLFFSAVLTLIGLIIFKYTPMYFYGADILFDASSHMAWTTLGLYVLWVFFVENKRNIFRKIYIFSSVIILVAMGIQRIVTHQHNLLGVLLGTAIAIFSIWIFRRRK